MRTSQRFRKTLFPFRRRWASWFRPNLQQGGPPRGTFSETENIAEGKIPGAILPQPNFPVIPESSEVIQAGLDQHRYTNWQTVWSRRDQAFLAAPSLCHSDGTGRVCSESVYGIHSWADPVWMRKEKHPLRELTGDYTSIVSRWNQADSYYHWFMDGLTRLIHLDSFPADCRIIIPQNPSRFALRSIEMLGLSEKVIEADESDLKIERYWFAGPTMLSGCPDPRGVRWLREKFISNPSPGGGRKIYIDRTAPTRHLSNSQELRDFFVNKGWEVLDPGTLSLDEQISKFGEASLIAGAHGAAMTNLLWAPRGTKILEFMPSRRRNGCYAGIALAAGMEHRTLVCPSDINGNMEVPVSGIQSWLDSVV